MSPVKSFSNIESQTQSKIGNKESGVLSVMELTRFIKIQLESRFPTVQVMGEVSNLSRQSSGHIYFSLKDRHASLSCVLWRSAAARIKLPLDNGMQVVLGGSLRVYEPRGAYQLSVTSIYPAGLGNLHLEFERRKLKFEKLGYFSEDRKRKLPEFPQNIAIITSPTGAVIQDMLRVINRRCSIGLKLDIYPVKVQGPGAELEIASSLKRIGHRDDLDLIIIGRGGGSLEDLWAFNEDAVVEAIYESRVPVISAVGHETDFTLADFVSDVRAATPSVAAELAVPEIESWRLYLQERLVRMRQELSTLFNFEKQNLEKSSLQVLARKLNHYLERYHQDLDYTSLGLKSGIEIQLTSRFQNFKRFTPIRHILGRAINSLCQNSSMRLDSVKLSRIARTTLSKIDIVQKRLNDSDVRLKTLSTDLLRYKNDQLKLLMNELTLSDPKQILSKGYAMVKKDDRIAVCLDELSTGDNIRLLMQDGELSAKIVSKEMENKNES
ncbi:MAG: exodeoxyribonuclease VII large subunit [bacterium]|nr:exodeoxyribonuclease VII large subunit [bacterium]